MKKLHLAILIAYPYFALFICISGVALLPTSTSNYFTLALALFLLFGILAAALFIFYIILATKYFHSTNKTKNTTLLLKTNLTIKLWHLPAHFLFLITSSLLIGLLFTIFFGLLIYCISLIIYTTGGLIGALGAYQNCNRLGGKLNTLFFCLSQFVFGLDIITAIIMLKKLKQPAI